eukprot:TRINITY_DN79275_c0_g1_i1.p4 TRINITY_DN79275_c0_g1~~TRINITY_DN79275_c0_g1_i1.p4  ORF type:complete len:104 (-),score=3.08 TRINITY_DN79275_c0_g1_i1:144-455(-)
MRLLPIFARQRFLGGRLVPGTVQPAMPFGAHPARLGLAIEDHPTFGIVLVVIELIALIVFAHSDALAPGEKLRVQRLAVPPGHAAQESVQDTHWRLRLLLGEI